jgi:shikimate kinase
MNLILIGYRCTGKTTVGRILADRLGWPLVDTDTLVQERAGRSIKEIVAEAGWPEFRRLEKEVIADVAAGDEQVVSAGGGAVLDPDNRAAMRAGGRVVLLESPAEIIWQRMKADPKTAAERPDLTDEGGIAEVRSLLQERREAYESACHFRVDTGRLGPDAAADAILKWFDGSRE